jgi:predicted metal-dependent peptidase
MLPPGVLTPQRFSLPPGKTAEEYAQLLLAREQEQGGGEGEPAEGKARPGAGRCGSAATGRPEPWELPADGSGDEPGLGEVERELVRREVARAIKEAGRVPAGLARWVDGVLEPPRIDWRRELTAMVRRAAAQVAGCTDYSYGRPGRRSTPGVIMPRMVSPRVTAAVVVDTSGSMSSADLAEALAEVTGIVRAVGAVELLACEVTVMSRQRVASAAAARLVGGGGTDMGAGIADALRGRPRPDIIVVLTDGYTPWPEAAPPARVVICLVGARPAERSSVPSWAHVVEVAA